MADDNGIKHRLEGCVNPPTRKCSLSEPETARCDHYHRPMGLSAYAFFQGDDAVTIPDYVAIGLLAVCLMLWAGTALLARKS